MSKRDGAIKALTEAEAKRALRVIAGLIEDSRDQGYDSVAFAPADLDQILVGVKG